MFIEVVGWADFDIPITLAVFDIGQASIDELLSEFQQKGGIGGTLVKDGIEGLKSRDCNAASDLFMEFLKKKGYHELKTKKISFSD